LRRRSSVFASSAAVAMSKTATAAVGHMRKRSSIFQDSTAGAFKNYSRLIN
jgi:hypothetical protein